MSFSKLIEPIYATLPESIKKQYQTRLTNNKITSTFSFGSIQNEDEDNAKKAHAIILKVQASYLKKTRVMPPETEGTTRCTENFNKGTFSRTPGRNTNRTNSFSKNTS